MGFPTDVVLPKVFVQLLSLLYFIKELVTIFSIDSSLAFPESMPEFQSVNPLLLIREIMPVVKFSELELELELELAVESCAVCICEFKAEDEIQRLTNCRHIFHRSCLDRWMGYDHTTCPLCRTTFLPRHMQDA